MTDCCRLLCVSLGAGLMAAQSPAEVERHIAAAKAAAANDHVGLFDRICTEARNVAAPRGGGARPGGAGRQAGPPPAPPRESWHAEPTKVFDNLYYVGMTEFSAWAVTTSQGIILSMPFRLLDRDEVVGGLRSSGWTPPDQVRWSATAISTTPAVRSTCRKVGRDYLCQRLTTTLLDSRIPLEAQARHGRHRWYKLTLGDTTLTFLLTLATEGTISTLLPVRDGGQPHVAAAGWHGVQLRPEQARLGMYVNSSVKFRDIVQRRAPMCSSPITRTSWDEEEDPALASGGRVSRPLLIARRGAPVSDCRQRVRAGGAGGL